MATPTYVAKKIGDEYVLVPKHPLETGEGAFWLIGGASCLVCGALRRGLSGTALSILGAGMLYRGATGSNPIRTLFGLHGALGGPSGDPRQSPSFQNDEHPSRQLPTDEVEEASMESFPASDPPAGMASHATPAHSD